MTNSPTKRDPSPFPMTVKVKDVRRYRSFEQMLRQEPWKKIAPESSSREEVLSLLKQIYPYHKEKLGVVVFEFSRADNN